MLTKYVIMEKNDDKIYGLLPRDGEDDYESEISKYGTGRVEVTC